MIPHPTLVRIFLMACLVTVAFVIGCSGRFSETLDPAAAGRWEPASAARSITHQGTPPPITGDPSTEAAWSSTDEVWVIAAPPRDAARDAHQQDQGNDTPGSGAMLAPLPVPGGPGSEPRLVPLPLTHTDVRGEIAGYIASVDVTQQFTNPFDEKIEAVYVFPLPHDAAVNEFVMTIGGRRIRGIIRERAEAERVYLEARAQGYRAALLTQERPNIFTQKVANLEPGKRIDVHIRYFHTLAYEDGWYAWHFPMVVGPRFNPPGTAQPVVAVERSDRREPASGATTVPYLRPEERSGHDISLTVTLGRGVMVEELRSVHHRVETTQPYEGGNVVSIAGGDTIPNKDFVLRFRIAGETMKSSLITHRPQESDGEGYFTLMLYPPADLSSLPQQPVELIFVADASGSMNGRPLAQAKAAAAAALRQLQPGDAFQIVRFSDRSSSLGGTPLPATPDNIRRGLRYLDQLDSGGGTVMRRGINAALGFPHDRSRLRFVCFLTDGYIGNEAEVFAAVHKQIGDARIFSFGVGSSVNRYLMDGLARMGRGAAAYLALGDDPEPVMNAFLERIRRPAMTDVTIDWNGMDVTDVFPRRLPDVFVGRPLLVTGRFRGGPASLPAAVHIHGHAGREGVGVTALLDAAVDYPAIATVWARTQIESLTDRLAHSGDPGGAVTDEITRLALEHNLMSAYTALLAVDAADRTAGTRGTTIHQPVPVPDGVRYETTVSD